MDRRRYRGPTCGGGVDRAPSRGGCEYYNKNVRDATDKRSRRIAGFDDNQRDFPVGMCYVPWQRFDKLYSNEFEALKNATLFKELSLGWYGRGCS